jgi:hypothetical protein
VKTASVGAHDGVQKEAELTETIMEINDLRDLGRSRLRI